MVPGCLLKWLNLVLAPGLETTNPVKSHDQQSSIKKIHAVSWRNHAKTITTVGRQRMWFWPKINILYSCFHIFMPYGLIKTFNLKFDSCQTVIHQNNLLWPCCTPATGIRLGTGVQWSCSTRGSKSDSLHLIPELIILTWLWIYPFCLSNISFPWQFVQCDPPSRTSMLDLSARDGGGFHCCWSLILITITMVVDKRSIPQLQNSYPTHKGF